MTFKTDQWLVYGGREGRVVRVPNLHEVHLVDRNGDLFTAPISGLVPLANLRPAEEATLGRDVDSPGAEVARREAEVRLEAISPLLELGRGRTRKAVEERAAACGYDPVTLYRWIRQYETTGTLGGLVRRVRRDSGVKRLSAEVEQRMEAVIEKHYLVEERPTMSSVYQRLRVEIDQANRTRAPEMPVLATPDFQTFRRRIYGVEERRRRRRRHGSDAAEALEPSRGQFPGATHPLAVAQMDHVKLDVMVVDGVHRLPLSREVWATVVMDVCSRVVLGLHISLEAPSAFSTGQAIAHAILPKETWLASHREAVQRMVEDLEPGEHVELTWPCWGKPALIHTDNGAEFWSETLEAAATDYHFKKEFRPKKRPRYGGHIERIQKTLLGELQSLPGTTFGNVVDRGDYDSEGRAVMTVEGLELLLTAFILGVYHNRVHSALGVTPLQAWERGLLIGTNDAPPPGLPERLTGDRAERLRMDFLPSFKATIQRDGVKQDGLRYLGPVLHRYIKAKDPQHPTRSRLFTFRRDPNDVSQIFFLDPELDRYFAVRNVQPDFPSISIWEVRATKRFAKEQNVRADDDRSLLSAYRLMYRITRAEGDRTRQVRLEEEKKKRREKNPAPKAAAPAPKPSDKKPALSIFDDVDDIEPFEDIRV